MDTGQGQGGVGLRDAASRLGVSPRTIRRYVQSGRLPAVQVLGPHGMEYLIADPDLDAFLASNRPQARPPSGKGQGRDRTQDTMALATVVQAVMERQSSDAAALERAWARIADLERDLATARAQLGAGPVAPRRLSWRERLRGRVGD